MHDGKQLIEILGGGEPNQTSMDVLLQLTLPIVLILALVMATEISQFSRTVASLEAQTKTLAQRAQHAEEEARSAREDLARSAAGELVKELEQMVLTIQHQLLIKAVEQVAKRERERLKLADYASFAPAPSALFEQRVPPAFRETTAGIAAAFNGARARATTKRRWAASARQVFAELVARYLEDNAPMRRRGRTLSRITPENRPIYQGLIDGQLQLIRREAFAVQLELLTAWLEDAALNSTLDAGNARALWQKLQVARGDELEALMDQFVNLKIRAAFAALSRLGMEPLEDVRATAIGSAR
ncbi:MAG: hypothetical protein GKR94_34565 [Gammaproteobacteria bacterium]|nr:hypothetical protein [Gammaproteobacteria bacterium]